MKLFERYVAAAILRSTLLSLVALLGLLVLLGFVDEMDDVGKGLYATGDAFLVALLAIPRYTFEVFPVAALIGSLIGLGMLANHGELVAIRAAGMSLRQILGAVLKIGLVMMIGVFLVGEVIAPTAEQFGQRYKAEQQQQQVTLLSRYGFWAKDGAAFVNIRDILPGARLEDISIYEITPSRELQLVTRASHAEHDGQHWTLYDIEQTSVSPRGTESRRVEQATWSSLIDPNLISLIIVKPTMLPLWGLHRYIRFMTQNGQSAISYEVAFWTKIATPFATLVMQIIAVPFVLGSLRSVGIGQRIFVGAMLGSVFYLLSRGFSYVAVVYDLPPWLAAGLPALAFALLGIVLLRRAI